MIQPTTPYMLRKDGNLLPCGDIHPYLKSFDIEDIDSVLEVDDLDLQWYYDNSNDEIKDAVVNFRKDKTINNLNKLNNLINNEFCKVRTSNHKYKYGGDNGEIYFRLCNNDNFNWFDLIWETVLDEKDYVKNVTIMRDYQTFGKQFDYCKIKGKPIKHIPVEEFITITGNPVLESLEEPPKDIINLYIEQIEEAFNMGQLEYGVDIEELEDYVDTTLEPEGLERVYILWSMLELAKRHPYDWAVYKNKKTKSFLLINLKQLEEEGYLNNGLTVAVNYYNLTKDDNNKDENLLYLPPEDYLGEK